MDELELEYEAEGDVPEGYAKLYTEKDGKFQLTGVKGMKTQTDVNNVQEGLRKERENHAETLTKLKAFGKLDAAETFKSLDRIKELEAAAGGKLDEDKINEIVEGRIAQQTGPLTRQVETLTKERDEAVDVGKTLQGTIAKRDMGEQIQEAAIIAKVHTSAIPDIKLVAMNMMELNEEGLLITRAEGSLTPGLNLEMFFKEMGKSRPHWWPESEGGGAKGSRSTGGPGGDNPWSNKSWNVTKQGEIYKTQGSAIATAMAKTAGTVLGGAKPLAA